MSLYRFTNPKGTVEREFETDGEATAFAGMLQSGTGKIIRAEKAHGSEWLPWNSAAGCFMAESSPLEEQIRQANKYLEMVIAHRFEPGSIVQGWPQYGLYVSRNGFPVGILEADVRQKSEWLGGNHYANALGEMSEFVWAETARLNFIADARKNLNGLSAALKICRELGRGGE